MFGLKVRCVDFNRAYNYVDTAIRNYQPMPCNMAMRAPLVALEAAKLCTRDEIVDFACGDRRGPYAVLLRASLHFGDCDKMPECEIREFMGDLLTRGISHAWRSWDYKHRISEHRGLHKYLSASKLSPSCRTKLKLVP